MKIKPKDILEEQKRMEQNRKPYEGLMDYCSKLTYPNRQPISEWMNINSKGQMVGKSVFDATAMNAVEVRANGIMAFFMPTQLDWFKQKMANRKIRDVKNVIKFLQNWGEQLRFAINRSNYHAQKRLKILDGSVLGTAYMTIDEDAETGKIMCNVPNPRSNFVTNDYWGIPRRTHEVFYKTLRQINDEYKEGALDDTQKLTLAKSPDTNVKLIKAVYKNSDFNPKKPVSNSNRRWLRFIVNTEAFDTNTQTSGKIIESKKLGGKGYNTVNPIIWQHNKPTDEDYGRGDVSQFIIEIITANDMMKHLLLSTQMKVRQPMIMLDSIKPFLQYKPGGVTFVNRNLLPNGDIRNSVSQLLQDTDISYGFDMLKHFQTIIDSRFGVPFFLMMNRLAEMGGDAYKNIYQIQQMQAERAALMSPFLATLSVQTDMELDRFSDIEFSAGRMPDVPQEILDSGDLSINIEYTGPIVQLLEQMYQKSAIYAIVNDTMMLMNVDEMAAINVDWDKINQKLMRDDNIPEEALVPLNDVKEIRMAIAQKQEAAQNAAMAAQTAKMLPAMQQSPEEGSLVDMIKKNAA